MADMGKRQIFSAKAAERDYFCFTDVDEASYANNPYVPEHILRTYDAKYPGLWNIEPLDRCIVSICRYAYPDRDRSIFVSLSAEGDVGFIGKEEGFYEKIPGAGLLCDDADGYGYMKRIRQIGTDLFACGHNGQVYRRLGPDDWRRMDAGILLPPSGSDPLIPSDVNGADPEHLYLVADDGKVFFHDGRDWRKIPVPTDEWLYDIYVESRDTNWICGRNGTLLRGNERSGFSDLSSVRDNATFLSIAGFGGKIYLGHADGVSVFDGHRIEHVTTGLKPDLSDGHLVDVVDGVLWSFGYNDIARFDGTVWRRFPTDAP